MKLTVGTRGSELALKQTELVLSKLKSIDPGLEVETVKIRTSGDARQTRARAGAICV